MKIPFSSRFYGCLAMFIFLPSLSLAQYESWPYEVQYPEYFQQPAPEYHPHQVPSDVVKIQVRLAGQKRKHNEGRVEVYYEGQWGTVCDDDFSIHAAHVVCREVGYVEAKSWTASSSYGPGEGPIWLDNVHCTGKEATLAACSSNGWGVTDCKHTEDVGVVCSDKRIPGQPLVRLRGGAQVGEGRVEVLKNGEWGTVCDDKWDLVSASVVCRELGFGTAKEAPQLRLNGGRNPYEGRVEVLTERNGSLVWGTVCGQNWGIVEAMVVCRQLGLGFASNAFQETWYWHGNVFANKVVMSGVKCSGTELSLAHCRHDEEVTCPEGGVRFGAGVACSETAPDLVLNAEIVQQTAYLEDRPMFLLQCAMEENCLSASAVHTNPTTGYRRLLRFSSQIHNNGQSDFRPKNGRHAWIWHDCHRHYHSMEVFTYYDLLSLNGTKVAEGHKASFCLEDTECEGDIQKSYECANFGEQGITMGCWDMYRHDIDCQWIDITDVPPGDYLFQVVINPNYEVPESDFSNNIMKCRSRYDGYRIWMYNCHVGGALSEETEQKFEHFSGLLNNQLSVQ
ncbi:Lysyl oxidase homolog 2 [Lemmus lemmus]